MNKKTKEELRKKCRDQLKLIDDLKKKITETPMNEELMRKLRKAYGIE